MCERTAMRAWHIFLGFMLGCWLSVSVALLTFKLTGAWDASWLWVLAPLWAPVAVVLVGLSLYTAFAFFWALVAC